MKVALAIVFRAMALITVSVLTAAGPVWDPAGPRSAMAVAPSGGQASTRPESPVEFIRARYTKTIHRVPMRDGTKLFTVVYSPKDTSQTFPILINRTPYGVNPSGLDDFPGRLGPNILFAQEGYIFAYQDVRGRGKSEGEFEQVRPHLEHKSKPTDVDESTDTYDMIEYLLKNVPNHNGRVGMWGFSYPGFYCSAGMIDAHPALKAVSPQAPVGDWYFDDVARNGTCNLPSVFGFLSSFVQFKARPQGAAEIKVNTPDEYQFFLELGPLANLDARYFYGQVDFWTQMTRHPEYDEFWESHNILPRLKHVAPAVLVVGGWFDADDLYGALATYRAIEKQNPGIANTLVMGPWRHGGWAGTTGERLGNISFGGRTSDFFQKGVEIPFFLRYLKDKPEPPLPEAYAFETGRNQWRNFDHWPPSAATERAIYLNAGGKLSWEASSPTSSAAHGSNDESFDAFISDPAKPVPVMGTMTHGIPFEFMTDDQRFAAQRPDVLVYQTEALRDPVTIAGPITADLWVSTSAGDADWVVKVIDVYPPDAKDNAEMAAGQHLAGYQMMVRCDVIRGRYRDGFAKAKPFVPNEPTLVRVPLLDVLHTFQPGHRIMVQVQSSWFPLADRNPQKYVDNIFQASEADFIKATHRVYHDGLHATRLRVGGLE